MPMLLKELAPMVLTVSEGTRGPGGQKPEDSATSSSLKKPMSQNGQHSVDKAEKNTKAVDPHDLAKPYDGGSTASPSKPHHGDWTAKRVAIVTATVGATATIAAALMQRSESPRPPDAPPPTTTQPSSTPESSEAINSPTHLKECSSDLPSNPAPSAALPDVQGIDAAYADDGSMQLFSRQADGGLRVLRGNSWGDWTPRWSSIGGSLGSDPSVIAWEDGSIDVLAVSSNDVRQLVRYTCASDGKWQSQASVDLASEGVGEPPGFTPSVARLGGDRWIVAYVDQSGALLYGRGSPGSPISKWQRIDDTSFTSGPAVAVHNDGEVRIFVRNQQGSISAYTIGSDLGWSPDGSLLTPVLLEAGSAPGVAVRRAVSEKGQLILTFRGVDQLLYKRTLGDEVEWRNLKDEAGASNLSSDPAVATPGSRIHYFALVGEDVFTADWPEEEPDERPGMVTPWRQLGS
jgi:hypothetical protein